MSQSPPRNLIHYFKKFFYLIVLIGFSAVHAGSFDDFFTAVKRDEASTVTDLLNRGFDVNAVTPGGDHGLHIAVRESSLKVLAVLLGWPRIKVEARTPRDESALMLAALKGMTAVCTQLIERGADVNKPGWTPLHYAATNGHLAVMSLLLDNFAYLDAASPNGSTPLMMAAGYGSASAVKLLLEAGADPMLKNDLGLSAIDFAHQANRLEAANIIAAFVRAQQPPGEW